MGAAHWFVLLPAVASVLAAGCVREVLSGTDPEARGPRISTDASKNEVVVSIPWMPAPQPRLLYKDQLTRAEAVFARSPDRVTHFTVRSVAGTTAMVDLRTQHLAGESLEFAYEVIKLPADYSVDVVVPIRAAGPRPACDVSVNGAPVKVAPDTEVVAVILARDAPTRIVVTPRPAVQPSAPVASPASSAPPPQGTP
jgi:hypothetical protein